MGNNPISTVVDAVSDNRTYGNIHYNCPRCGKRVWAYGSFAGNVCFDCPGTVVSAIGNTSSMATFGATQPVATLLNHTASEITQTAKAVVTAPINVVKELPDMVNDIDSVITGNRAERTNNIIFKISPSDESDYLSDSYKNQKISRVTSKSCGILCGITNGSGVDHWWMNIRTINGNDYQIQFQEDGSQIVLRACSSVSECDQNGLAEGNRAKDSRISNQSGYSKVVSGDKTLNDLVNWLKSGQFSCRYSLYNNNCQDLCKAIYQWL